MNKKKIIIIVVILVIISVLICIYPKIEFYSGKYLYMMSYSNDFVDSEDFYITEEETCYDESYSYDKERDISIIDFEYKKFLFFKWFKIKYEKGNICETEFLLEEVYINNFLENAVILESDDVDLASLIKDKQAIVSNKRYPWNDEYKWISYKLNGKYEEMFISIDEEGLIIIQVGLSDEGPKYIAYK